jgi:hypothetical protein
MSTLIAAFLPRSPHDHPTTPGIPPVVTPPPRSRRGRAAAIAGLTAALTLASAAVGAGVASAAPPAFPDNVVVFPDRDFVTIEGYQDRIGQTALVEVTRAGQVVGSAQGVVETGDVAFEINHPGGYCWGAGTDLAVTPDIKPGDTVSIRFAGALAGDTVVQDTFVDTKSSLSGNTLTVTGRIAAGVDRTRLEQRIVNPDLTDLPDVARRDVRAIPGGPAQSAKGNYRSALFVVSDRFTATYEFTTPEAAQTAANGGGERMMAWQVEDEDGNRQGLTIAEYGEQGGPGMGGCPVGPSQQGAPKPGDAAVVRSGDRTSMQVSWTPASAVPGAAAVTGYSVVAVAKTVAAGQQVQVGTRTLPNATSTTIAGLAPGETYDVEVRSLAGPATAPALQMSETFPVSSPATPPNPDPGPAGPTPNATFDKPTATAGSTGVTLASTTTGTEIYYTTDGSEPRMGDLPSNNALLYKTPVVITAANTTLKSVAFDKDGNFSDTATAGPFQPTAPAAPASPTAVAATALDRSARVTWTGTPAATKYVVTATPASGATPTPVTQEAPAGATSATVAGLTNGVDYSVTVTAYAGTALSPASGPPVTVRPVATVDRLTITTARWKAGDFRVGGTGSMAGANLTVHRVNADGTAGAAITGATATVTAPVAPATVGDYSVRVRAGGPTTNPGRIIVKSDKGGATAPFTVTNG